MREPLYRGFRPDENGKTEITLNGEKIKGEWVEGYYCHCIEAVGVHESYPAIQQVDDGSLYFRKVLPETVGEYTGLTDKNGKKIFEGDIVVINTSNNCGNINGFTGIVIYHDCGFELQNIEDMDCYECMWYENIELEIIGNIHDNPELLEA